MGKCSNYIIMHSHKCNLILLNVTQTPFLMHMDDHKYNSNIDKKLMHNYSIALCASPYLRSNYLIN